MLTVLYFGLESVMPILTEFVIKIVFGTIPFYAGPLHDYDSRSPVNLDFQITVRFSDVNVRRQRRSPSNANAVHYPTPTSNAKERSVIMNQRPGGPAARRPGGHCTNGHCTNGHCTNGHCTNGHCINGHCTCGQRYIESLLYTCSENDYRIKIDQNGLIAYIVNRRPYLRKV